MGFRNKINKEKISILLCQWVYPIPQARLGVHVPCAIVIQSRFLVELLAVELIRHLLSRRMFVHEQFAIGQVGVELSDVGLGVGDVGSRAEAVGVVVEDVLVVDGVGKHVVGGFGLVPLHGRTGRRAGHGVVFGALYPTVGHTVVAQLLDDGVVALVRVLGFGRRALHRGHSRRRSQLAVVVLALHLYL